MPASALILSRSSNARVSDHPKTNGRNTTAAGGGRAPVSSSVPASGPVQVPEKLEARTEKHKFFGSKKKKVEEIRSDVDLLKAFQGGDERAYAELYVRRKSDVYTFCLRMLGGDSDAASDAFQEVFIKVYEKADTFRDGSNVMGWLYMIARNTCLNVHRAKKPNDTIENHQSLTSSDRTMMPEFGQEQSFLRELLEKAIASLPHEFREPFILREFDGFSYTEIAEMTSTTLAVTKVRIHRAKQKMREMLRPYLTDGDDEASEGFYGSGMLSNAAEE